MMRREYFIIAVLALILVATQLLLNDSRPAPPAIPQHTVCFADGSCVRTEIVSERRDRNRGLSGRLSLPADAGMLFVFSKDDRWGFWMPDMHFPIDMIWVDVNASIVHVEHGVPPCGDEGCPTYIPAEPARYVLEVNAGVAREHGLEVGQKVSLPPAVTG